MKVLMLTTGFPRFVGDLFGAFVSEQAHALNRRGVCRYRCSRPMKGALPGEKR